MEAVKEGAARYQLEQIDIARRLIRKYPDVLEQAYSVSDVERIFGKGRIASVLGIEAATRSRLPWGCSEPTTTSVRAT